MLPDGCAGQPRRATLYGYMARIQPFAAYRYTTQAGPIEKLVTQPYDKISPAMQARYLSLSPHNLVRVILGQRFQEDTDRDNVYTRAQRDFEDWIGSGILARDPQPCLYAYTQEFQTPDSGEKLIRKGFIGLGPVEDYAAGIVHRHEQTLTGPKKDRLELLRHTRAHFGQLFMLYPDENLAVDQLLDDASRSEPIAVVEDEYETVHRVWQICGADRIAAIQLAMADKKLLIADGHHRYETALAFRNENPDLPGARGVMMTFVNMHAPGLKILATHRVAGNMTSFDAKDLLRQTGARELGSVAALKDLFRQPAPDRLRIGIALGGGNVHVVDRARKAGELDVKILHQDILDQTLRISEEAIRDESNLQYVRGIDAAVEKVDSGQAQVAFLLEPTTVQQVADVAFSGGVMPQKSTDFYPKLLSGLTIYKVDG
jgi:uncharacterized protein (DUF1015 family)